MKFDAFSGKKNVSTGCLNCVVHVCEAVKMKIYAF